MFDSDIGSAIKRACTQESEALTLARAAQLVRKEIFKCSNTFSGTFDRHCQERSVPVMLKALIAMILNGPDIAEGSADRGSRDQAILTISQLLIFNSMKTASIARLQRHNSVKETPLPIYISLKIHSETRKKGLVELLHTLGLGISYKRVLTISNDIGNSVCSQFEKGGVVVPLALHQGVFTAGVVDNIDHNPTSTTSTDSFHGTSIFLIQHLQREPENISPSHQVIDQSVKGKTAMAHLPESYTDVRPVSTATKELFVPSYDDNTMTISEDLSRLEKQYEWLERCKHEMSEPDVDPEAALSWAAFHAAQQSDVQKPTAAIALMPLLMDNAHTLAMIKHAMEVISASVRHLNPGQTPVISMDQPLFALCKEVQWRWPDSHGEKTCVAVMGGLHIEMAALKLLGDWLSGSGWTNVISASGIASAGTADAYLKALHVTRTRHAHQVTAAALYVLQHKAYTEFTNTSPDCLSFEDGVRR